MLERIATTALIFLTAFFSPSSVLPQSGTVSLPGVEVLGKIDDEMTSTIAASFFFLSGLIETKPKNMSRIVMFIGPGAVENAMVSDSYLDGFTNDQRKVIRSFSLPKDGCSVIVFDEDAPIKEFLLASDTEATSREDLVSCILLVYARAVGLDREIMLSLSNQELISFIFEGI